MPILITSENPMFIIVDKGLPQEGMPRRSYPALRTCDPIPLSRARTAQTEGALRVFSKSRPYNG